MVASLVSFILRYKFVVLFYLLIILFLVSKRKRLTWYAKFIVLYRTKWGLKAMDRFVAKYRELVILLGYIGTGVGFIALLFISYIIVKNLIDLFVTPSMQSGVSLVLPGVNVPGVGVLPFWYWLIALFLIATIHEFGHGIVARAHKIPVHHSGLVFFGPIIGAFVEPDEQKMQKKSDIVQYSVMSAGPFANILLAVFALVLLNLIFTPLHASMVEAQGFSFSEYVTAPQELESTYPAQAANLPTSTTISAVNGQGIENFQELSEELFCLEAGDSIELETAEQSYNVTLTQHPELQGQAFLGINGIENEFTRKSQYDSGLGKMWFSLVDWIRGFLRWLFILSLGIGLFNLLPLPIVDGGRMTQIALHKLQGKEKGEKRYRQVALFFLFVLVTSLIFPLLQNLFTMIL